MSCIAVDAETIVALMIRFVNYEAIKNSNIENRNKFEYQMTEIQKRFEHLNLGF